MQNTLDGFRTSYRNSLKTWQNEYQRTVRKWKVAKRTYNRNADKHLAATVTFESANEPVVALGSTALRSSVSLDKMKPGDYYVIPNAMSLDVRNQKFRGTCAAFAGIRAVETLLNQHPQFQASMLDLSEQHFYWLSRPECMDKACSMATHSDGSYFDQGFVASTTANNPNAALRFEFSCPYVPYENRDNLTYTPLNNCYQGGLVQATQINQFLPVDALISELAQNRPVAAGFRLTPSFQQSKGIVRANDPLNKKQATGKHAGGHAVLLVGFIKLPEDMRADEGRYCAIMANSWGIGYGAGGYACLTEQWIIDNQIPYPADKQRSHMTSLSAVNLIGK